METKVITKIKSNTLEFVFGYWDDEIEEFIPITPDNIDELAKRLDCKPSLLDFLSQVVGDIATIVHQDLADIWKRLDDAGI